MNGLILALLAACLPSAAVAQAYRWVDENGQVHYSQTPPPGRAVTPVDPAPPPSSGGNQASLNQALESDIKDRPKREEAAAKAAEKAAAKGKNCTAAQERLRYLDASTARRLSVKDEKGQPARMTEEQFQEQRAAAQKGIGDNC